MPLENINLKNLSDEDLAALHSRTSELVQSRRAPQLEDIKPGMKPEEIKRVRDHIATVLAGLK